MKVEFTHFKKEFKNLKPYLIRSLIRVGNSGEYVFGKELEKFEQNVKKFLNAKYVLGVGNWTEGMIILCKAMGLKKNDEIITVSNSFIATCGAIAYAGCKPVLVDIGDDLNINEKLIEKKINLKTKAIMPVHLSGIPANLDKISKIAKKNKIFLIEDAAHAFGAKYKNKHVGTIGDVGIFSLHPRKNFHVFGDGGLMVTNNKALYKKMLLLRNHGLKNRDNSIIWGTNSRLDNLQASFGNIMMSRINGWNKLQLSIANYYSKHLKNFVKVPIYNTKISNPTFHQYIIRTSYRDKLKKFLKNKGIETAIHYPIPIHKQKAFINTFGKISLKKTEIYSKEILSLPMHHSLNKLQLKYVVKMIKLFFDLKDKKNKSINY
jgi:dTDP-4-amino-4,6-dideoxygalactose transaminase